jgi:hypothetical protein
MAWMGEIVEFENDNHFWRISVAYYNDVTPESRFIRTLRLPDTTTRPQALAAIQARGQELRAQIRLSEEKFVGQIIPIP